MKMPSICEQKLYPSVAHLLYLACIIICDMVIDYCLKREESEYAKIRSFFDEG